jgi:hypothetical protein
VHERHRFINETIVPRVAQRDGRVVERLTKSLARVEIDYSRGDFTAVGCCRVVDGAVGARVAIGVVRAQVGLVLVVASKRDYEVEQEKYLWALLCINRVSDAHADRTHETSVVVNDNRIALLLYDTFDALFPPHVIERTVQDREVRPLDAGRG